jgi:hypothetical protein
MTRFVLALTLLLASSAVHATSYNDCRIGFRDCIKAKKNGTEPCLKDRRECEAKVRDELHKNGGKAKKDAGKAAESATPPATH